MTEIYMPTGRLIGGSLYQMRANEAGRETLSFGVAYPKGSEQNWNETTWGKVIYSIGAAANPTTYKSSSYAWKVVNGDSQEPNTRGRAPASNEGYPGNWVIWFSQGWAPVIVDSATKEHLPPGAIMPGDYVEVLASVKPNNSAQRPGLYMNPVAVGLAAKGERISNVGIDTAMLAFGGGKTIYEKFTTVPEKQYSSPGATIPPVKNFDVLEVPAPRSAKVMTAKAGRNTYDKFISAGWTDEMLVAEGYLTP